MVSGHHIPKPCSTFAHFRFDDILTKAIEKQQFEAPTSIQKQAVPVALSGRDIIGIAKTGSHSFLIGGGIQDITIL